MDRYYTPQSAAVRVAGALDLDGEPSRVVDSACGTGNLLHAVASLYPDAKIAGMDQDREAIRALRRQRPTWDLSIANVLCERSTSRASVAALGDHTGALILNPPFSMGASAGLLARFDGNETHVSVAMAHLLRSIWMFSPRVIVALVPESLLHADRDDAARRYLRQSFAIREQFGLKNSTFSGARVNSTVIKLVRGAATDVLVSGASSRSSSISLVRGGLPLFQAERRRRGAPYLHSTDIGELVSGGTVETLPRVRTIARGLTSGHVLLLPRVGVPSRQLLKPVFLPEAVQLSDCVLSLQFATQRAAQRFAKAAAGRFDELLAQYRGTGARYTTVARIETWARGFTGLR